jgi:hypothetical protein
MHLARIVGTTLVPQLSGLVLMLAATLWQSRGHPSDRTSERWTAGRTMHRGTGLVPRAVRPRDGKRLLGEVDIKLADTAHFLDVSAFEPYIFVYQLQNRGTSFKLVRLMKYDASQWNSIEAFWLLGQYGIFRPPSGLTASDVFQGKANEDHYYLNDMFDLFAELKSLTKRNPQLKADIQAVRSEVATLDAEKISMRRKPIYYSIQNKAEELERETF